MTQATLAFVGVLVGGGLFALWAYVRARRLADLEKSSRATAARILDEARIEGDAVRREAQIQAKDLLIEAKAEWEQEAREQRREIGVAEKRIAQKEEGIDRKLEAFANREGEIATREEAQRQRERELEGRRTEYDQLVDGVRQKLEQTAGMTRDEAKRTLMEQMVDEARHDAAQRIRHVEAEAREEADRRAKKIVSIAIERMAGSSSPSERCRSSRCRVTT
jgi:ribonuclease Y